MITRLHSVRVDVADFDAAVRDYARLVGFAPVRIERNGEGVRSAFFAFANMALELRALAASDPSDPSDTPGGAGGAPPRFGQSGIRLAWEGEDPTTALADRGLTLGEVTHHVAESLEAGAAREFATWSIASEDSRQLPIELIVDESEEAVVPLHRSPKEASAPRDGIHGLDHVVVMSPAPDATRAFYADALGLRLALDETFDERGVRLLFFRLSGLTIEIGARATADPAPEKADRFGGLAWQVPDVDAIQSRLAGDGFDVSEVRTGHKPGTRVCTVRDPVHGVPTLLIQPVQPI